MLVEEDLSGSSLTEMSIEESALLLLTTLSNHLVQNVETLKTQEERNEYVQSFLETDNVLYELALPYVTCYQQSSFAKRDELEAVLTLECYKAGEQSILERLVKVEDEWDKFLETLDWHLNPNLFTIYPVSTFAPKNIHLWDVSNNRETMLSNYTNVVNFKYTLVTIISFYGCPYCTDHILNLHEYRTEFYNKHCNVLLLCKGSREGGKKWLDLVDIEFPLLADEHEEFVTSLQLRRRSYWNMCRTQVRSMLATRIVNGKPVPVLPDTMHDVFQLGANVIFDANGRILFTHLCKRSDDRLAAAELLSQIPQVGDTSKDYFCGKDACSIS